MSWREGEQGGVSGADGLAHDPSGCVVCVSRALCHMSCRWGSPLGLAPKIDNKTMCWRENKQLSAAPASRRLGRAGLEAPPLRGRNFLSF